MWFTADLPSAGPRGKLPRAGVESEVKDWLFPGTAGCVENPVNRGFQGDLPGSVSGAGAAAGGGGLTRYTGCDPRRGLRPGYGGGDPPAVGVLPAQLFPALHPLLRRHDRAGVWLRPAAQRPHAGVQ